LLVGEGEVELPTVAEPLVVEAVFESPSLSVVGFSLLPVVGLLVTAPVITLAEVLVSDEYLVDVVVSVENCIALVNVFTAAVDFSSVFGLVVWSSDVLDLTVVEEIETFAVEGRTLLGNALVLAEGLLVEGSIVDFSELETKLIGVEPSSEISVVTAGLVVDVSSVRGSGLLLGVVSTSSEVVVVTTALAVDVSSVRGSMLLLGVVSTSSEIVVVTTALAVDVSSVGGLVLLGVV